MHLKVPISSLAVKQFPPEELNRFLRKVDELLTQECSLVIIGGAAAALAYGVSRTTTDIDLALMKMVRGYENDIKAIEEIHQNNPLNLNLLTERFMDEMTQVTGVASGIRLNFLLMVEKLFGPEETETAERATEDWAALRVQAEARKEN